MEITIVIKSIYILWIYNPTPRNRSHRKRYSIQVYFKGFCCSIIFSSKIFKPVWKQNDCPSKWSEQTVMNPYWGSNVQIWVM